MTKKILIYIEKNNDVSTELTKKAHELAIKLNDTEIIGLLIGSNMNGQSYFDKVYIANDKGLENYQTETYSKIAIKIISEIKPDIILIGATTEGRDLAPQIASALHAGLTADCTSLDINIDGKLEATRPTFGGKLMATILSKGLPQMATVRPKVIKTNCKCSLKDTEYINIPVNTNDIEQKIKLKEIIKKGVKSSIEDSEIIIAGGKGIKDNLSLLYELSEIIGAKVAVSRAIVDLGLANSDIQVGQTGKTISPKLYIACGISGAIQHTVGIMGAKKIIAINKDKNAPIFKYADFGVVGDAVEILPELIKEMKSDI